MALYPTVNSSCQRYILYLKCSALTDEDVSMTKLVLCSQDISSLIKDDQVSDLTLTRAWLEEKFPQKLEQLSQLYLNIHALDLRDLELVGSNSSLIVSIATAFPEITELVLPESVEFNKELIAKVSFGFKLLKSLKFAAPAPIVEDNFSYLNPSSWDLSFFGTGPQVRHHDSLRDMFNVAGISNGPSNILSDWNRISNCSIEINGVSIFSIVHEGSDKRYFPDLNALKSFFAERLLAKLPQERQAAALDFTLKTLHQGGLQNPITASIVQYCARKESSPQPVDANNSLNGIPGQYRTMKFNATEDGFTVHEILKQSRLVYPITAGAQAGEFIMPDKDHSYVFKAEAKLRVCWSPNAVEPRISVNDVGITFGSAIAKTLIDKRCFCQEWLDNLSYYTGFNTVTEDVPAEPSLGM